MANTIELIQEAVQRIVAIPVTGITLVAEPIGLDEAEGRVPVVPISGFVLITAFVQSRYTERRVSRIGLLAYLAGHRGTTASRLAPVPFAVDAFWNVLDWERAESNYRDALVELDAK